MSKVEPLEPAPAAAQSQSGAPLAILFLTVFIDLLGFGIVIPFLPIYAERLHVGAAGIGLILASYSLMQFFAAPILGRISDRFGRRPVIMLGLLGSSVGYLIYGFAATFFGLLLSRAVHGICAGTVSTAQAYVADTTSEEKRAHGMGMIGAAFGLGFVLGPAIGGLLGRSSLRTPVFFAAALTFANLIFAALKLPESHQPDANAQFSLAHAVSPLLSLPRQLTRHRLTDLFMIAFLGTFAIAAFEATFALLASRMYGYGATGVGALLAFAGLVQAVVQGYLLRLLTAPLGELRLIRAGMIGFALGMAPMASLSSHTALIVMLALLSAGYGFANPCIASLISKRTEVGLQGEVLGVNQSALSLARICGPIAGGVIFEAIGPAGAYIGGGVAALIALYFTINLDAGA